MISLYDKIFILFLRKNILEYKNSSIYIFLHINPSVYFFFYIIIFLYKNYYILKLFYSKISFCTKIPVYKNI